MRLGRKYMKEMKIILASKSPRRREFLEKLGIDFDIIPAVNPEDMKAFRNIKKLSKVLGEQKAQEVFNKTEGNRTVIGSDSMVYVKGKLFGKPQNEDEGRQMLKSLSGNWHKVITSLCVIIEKNGERKFYSKVFVVKVKFMKLTDNMINNYLATGEYSDKAGSYAIQGLSSKFIECIKGDYSSIVGLPYCELYKILNKEGIIE